MAKISRQFAEAKRNLKREMLHVNELLNMYPGVWGSTPMQKWMVETHWNKSQQHYVDMESMATKGQFRDIEAWLHIDRPRWSSLDRARIADLALDAILKVRNELRDLKYDLYRAIHYLEVDLLGPQLQIDEDIEHLNIYAHLRQERIRPGHMHFVMNPEHNADAPDDVAADRLAQMRSRLDEFYDQVPAFERYQGAAWREEEGMPLVSDIYAGEGYPLPLGMRSTRRGPFSPSPYSWHAAPAQTYSQYEHSRGNPIPWTPEQLKDEMNRIVARDASTFPTPFKGPFKL